MRKFFEDAKKITEVEILINGLKEYMNKKDNEVTLEDVKTEIIWCIEKMNMDLEDISSDDIQEITYTKGQIKQCMEWLKKYSK